MGQRWMSSPNIFFHELIAIKQRVVDRAHCDQVYQQAAAVIRHDIAVFDEIGVVIPCVVLIDDKHAHAAVEPVSIEVEAAAGVVAERNTIIRFADHVVGMVMAEERARDIALLEPACILPVVFIAAAGAFFHVALRLRLINDIPF